MLLVRFFDRSKELVMFCPIGVENISLFIEAINKTSSILGKKENDALIITTHRIIHMITGINLISDLKQ